MVAFSSQTQDTEPRDTGYWAERVAALRVTAPPPGAVNLNVEGRQVVGALQGFGQLWQKTYRIRLAGSDITPADVMRIWKAEFPTFLPPQSRFYPTFAGVVPGEIVLINASVSGLPVYTGVVVIYADDESFTVMTAEGLPEAGWNTFSAYEEDGCTVVQIQSLARANDPIYEIGFRLIGALEQERIWQHVLTSVAARFGVDGQVEMVRTCVDPHVQWSQAKNVWQNAAMRSLLYIMSAPLRHARTVLRRSPS